MYLPRTIQEKAKILLSGARDWIDNISGSVNRALQTKPVGAEQMQGNSKGPGVSLLKGINHMVCAQNRDSHIGLVSLIFSSPLFM